MIVTFNHTEPQLIKVSTCSSQILPKCKLGGSQTGLRGRLYVGLPERKRLFKKEMNNKINSYEKTDSDRATTFLLQRILSK